MLIKNRKSRADLKKEKEIIKEKEIAKFDIETEKENEKMQENGLLKSIPSSKIFNFKNNKKMKYVTLKVIPDRTIGEEQKTYFLAKTLYSILQMKINAYIQNDDGSSYRNNRLENIKISYIIDLSDKVNFYFLVPQEISTVLQEKIYEVFTNCVVREVEDFELPRNSNQEIIINGKKKRTPNTVSSRSLELKYNDAFSLNTDNKLYNLEEMISNHHWLKDNDRITIMFNFTKAFDKDFLAFKQECIRKIELEEPKYKLLNNKIDSEFILSATVGTTSTILDTAMDTLVGVIGMGMNENIKKYNGRRKRINALERVSPFTREKISSAILDTEIVIMSKSEDSKRREYNLKCVSDSFMVLNDENEFIAKKVRPINKVDNLSFGVRKNLLSLKEISKFLLLPNNSVLTDNSNIEQIKVRQSKAMDFLKNGTFHLGVNNYKSFDTEIYLPSKYDAESLAYVLISPQGGGKTTLIANLAVNAYKKKQCNIFIDYIKDCEASKTVEKYINSPKDIVIMDSQDIKTLPLIDFNEYDISKLKTEEEIGIAISAKIDATESIINTLNEEQELTANMSEILSQCCQIVYSFPHTNFGNVIDFICDYNYRVEILEKAKSLKFKDKVLNKKLNEALIKVDVINEYGKSDGERVVVGTVVSKVNGIMARISQIKKSYLLYNMVYSDKCKQVNFVDLMENGKTVLIRLPEHGVNPSEKNVISTFITMKTILATKIRGGMHEQPPRSNLWIDEVYQVKTVENVIHISLSQLRKYGLKVILSVHRMSQLNNKKFKDELLSSGASFTLLRGCKEIQVKDFLDRLNNYTPEDIYNLEPFHALHLINSNADGEWQGVTKLPPPLNHNK